MRQPVGQDARTASSYAALTNGASTINLANPPTTRPKTARGSTSPSRNRSLRASWLANSSYHWIGPAPSVRNEVRNSASLAGGTSSGRRTSSRRFRTTWSVRKRTYDIPIVVTARGGSQNGKYPRSSANKRTSAINAAAASRGW